MLTVRNKKGEIMLQKVILGILVLSVLLAASVSAAEQTPEDTDQAETTVRIRQNQIDFR